MPTNRRWTLDTQIAETQWSQRLTALAHPARIEIVHYLAQRNTCFCKDIVAQLPLAQSTISQHLKVLVNAGLVDCKSEAPRSRYTLNQDALLMISKAVSDLAGTCCRNTCCQSEHDVADHRPRQGQAI